MNAMEINRKRGKIILDIDRTWADFVSELSATSDAQVEPTMGNKLLVYLITRGVLPDEAPCRLLRDPKISDRKCRRLARI